MQLPFGHVWCLCYAYCISRAILERGICIKAEGKNKTVCLLQPFFLSEGGRGDFRPLNVSCLAKLGKTGCPRGVILLTDFRIWGVSPRTPSAKHEVLVTA